METQKAPPLTISPDILDEAVAIGKKLREEGAADTEKVKALSAHTLAALRAEGTPDSTYDRETPEGAEIDALMRLKDALIVAAEMAEEAEVEKKEGGFLEKLKEGLKEGLVKLAAGDAFIDLEKGNEGAPTKTKAGLEKNLEDLAKGEGLGEEKSASAFDAFKAAMKMAFRNMAKGDVARGVNTRTLEKAIYEEAGIEPEEDLGAVVDKDLIDEIATEGLGHIEDEPTENLGREHCPDTPKAAGAKKEQEAAPSGYYDKKPG